LGDLLPILLRRKLLILLCVAMFAGATALWNTQRPAQYRASTKVLVTDPAEPVLGGREAARSGGVPSVDTQIALLKGASAAREIARKVGEKGVGANEVLGRLEIEEVEKTSILRLSASAGAARRCAAIANAAAEVFLQRNEAFYHARELSARRFLDQQLPTYEEKLRAAERDLRLFREAAAAARSEEGAQRLSRALDTFEAAAAQTAVDLGQERQQSAELERQLSRESRALLDPKALRNNVLLEDLKAKLVDAESRYAVAQRKYTEKFPGVLPDLKAEIAALHERLASELGRVASGSAGDLSVQQSLVRQVLEAHGRVLGLEARQSALTQVVAGYRRQMGEVPRQDLELARLRREVSVAEGLYTALLQRRQELELSLLQTRGSAAIVERAVVPKTTASGAAGSFAFALALGLVVGLVAAFLMEAASRSGGPGGPQSAEAGSPELQTDETETDLSGRSLVSRTTWWRRRAATATVLLVAAGACGALLSTRPPESATPPPKPPTPARLVPPVAEALAPTFAHASEEPGDPLGARALAPSLGDLLDGPEEREALPDPVPAVARRPVGEQVRPLFPPLPVLRPLPTLSLPLPAEGATGAALSQAAKVEPAPSPGCAGDPTATAASRPNTPEPQVAGSASDAATRTAGSPAPTAKVELSSPAPRRALSTTGAGGLTRSSSTERPAGIYALWLGELDTVAQAERLRTQLLANGWKAALAGTRSDTGSAQRVEVGPFSSREAADRACDQLRAQGHRGQVVYKFSP